MNALVATSEAKPVSFLSMVSYAFTDYGRALRPNLAHVPFLQEPDKALRVIGSVIDYAEHARLARSASSRGMKLNETPALRTLRDVAKGGSAPILDEIASKALLRDCGLPVPQEVCAFPVTRWWKRPTHWAIRLS